MKKCNKCGLEKCEEKFNKWYKKTGRSGYRKICKDCDHLQNKLFRDTNKEFIKVQRRKRNGSTERGLITDPIRKKRNEDIYRSQRKYPEKVAARNFINAYIKMGKIVRPDICEICLQKKKVEGHHEDYQKPLEVKWVCKRCHADIHWKDK